MSIIYALHTEYGEDRVGYHNIFQEVEIQSNSYSKSNRHNNTRKGRETLGQASRFKYAYLYYIIYNSSIYLITR